MTTLHFEWDDAKAKANVKKHGVSFDEAKTVFYDDRARLIEDPDHSEDEQRFILLGFSSGLKLLVVCLATVHPRVLFASSRHERQRSKRRRLTEKVNTMRSEYDFSKSSRNPYATQLKKQITIRLDEECINYFKAISEDVGIPYQSLINLYLRDCAASNRKLNIKWK